MTGYDGIPMTKMASKDRCPQVCSKCGNVDNCDPGDVGYCEGHEGRSSPFCDDCVGSPCGPGCRCQCHRGAPLPAPSTDRSDKDYAIEFGGYLATAAEGYMDAINKYSAALCDSDYLSDHWRGLQNAVGEFRKRAQRAKETPSSAPVEPEVIRQWRDPKVAWLSPWHKEILAYIDGLKGKP